MEGSRRRRLALAGALALFAFGAIAPLARADDSQIRISEVYSDASVATGDYVELQLMADGQQFLSGRVLRLYNAAGNAAIDFGPLPTDPFPASESQRTILLGRTGNPNADYTTSSSAFISVPNGGAVCLLQSNAVPGVPIDCVTWGNFSGAFPTNGTPAPALNAAQSLTRTEARGCPTALDAQDDTNNSAADFSLQSPSPRSNLVLPSERLCTTPAPPPPVKKCKKKKKHGRSAGAAKKGCKKKKKH